MKIVSLLVSGALVLSALQAGCVSATAQPVAQMTVATPPRSSANTTQSSPLSADELDQLVAPIALYPDALVAQILAGASFPTEVVEAERWLKAHPELKGQPLAQA